MVITRAALKAGGVEVTGISDIDSDHLSSSAAETLRMHSVRPLRYNWPQLLTIQGQ